MIQSRVSRSASWIYQGRGFDSDAGLVVVSDHDNVDIQLNHVDAGFDHSSGLDSDDEHEHEHEHELNQQHDQLDLDLELNFELKLKLDQQHEFDLELDFFLCDDDHPADYRAGFRQRSGGQLAWLVSLEQSDLVALAHAYNSFLMGMSAWASGTTSSSSQGSSSSSQVQILHVLASTTVSPAGSLHPTGSVIMKMAHTRLRIK